MKQVAIAFLAVTLSSAAFAHSDADAYVGTSVAAYASDKGTPADKGIVIDGSYGLARIDTSFDSVGVSVPTNDVWNLGVGYMWQPDRAYAHGVIVSVDRFNNFGIDLEGEGRVAHGNANAYNVVYAGEYKLSRHVALMFDAGYSLLETKVEKGGPQDTANGVTGSLGLGYIVPAGAGETLVYVEMAGSRYFDLGDVGGATAAIVGGNIGVRHRF